MHDHFKWRDFQSVVNLNWCKELKSIAIEKVMILRKLKYQLNRGCMNSIYYIIMWLNEFTIKQNQTFVQTQNYLHILLTICLFLVWCLCIAYLIVISEISSTLYPNESFIYTVLITYTQTILTFTKLNTLLLYQYLHFLNLMRLFYLQELEVERALEQKRLTDFQGWLSEVRQKRQVTSLKDH